MRIYLVRHGQTQNNLLGQNHILRNDVPINITGIQQAEAAAELLATIDSEIELILASPYQRTRQTSQIIGKKLNIDPKIDKNITESDFGDWNGKPFTEVAPLYEKIAPEQIIDFRPPNGESWRDMAKRMVRTINDYHTQNVKAVVVVSHRDPILAAVSGLLYGLDNAWPDRPIECNNGAIFGLGFADGEWRLLFANRTH